MKGLVFGDSRTKKNAFKSIIGDLSLQLYTANQAATSPLASVFD